MARKARTETNWYPFVMGLTLGTTLLTAGGGLMLLLLRLLGAI